MNIIALGKEKFEKLNYFILILPHLEIYKTEKKEINIYTKIFDQAE
nr:hypothetical protein [Anaerococcus mediterraneensis]